MHQSAPVLPAFAATGYHNIDSPEICGMINAVRNNIKGGDLVSTEILGKGVKALGDTEV
jgi:hypothetical protein